jgi:hypothetical protein
MLPLRVFISYSHNSNDRPLLDQLIRHISPLAQQGKISVWEDSMIMPGSNWDEVINTEIRRADIVLFLVSSDYLASDYVHRIEVPIAMQRQADGFCTVVPVLLRSCMFELMPYAEYEFLPKTAHDQRLVPLDLWANKDEAIATIVRKLNVLVKQAEPKSAQPTASPVPVPTKTPPPSTVSEIERKGQEQQLALATQKQQHLKTALLLETGAAQQFALEHEIQKLDNTINDLKNKLQA